MEAQNCADNLARMWIKRYGGNTPEQLREWAAEPVQDEAARRFLEEVADIAESILRDRAPVTRIGRPEPLHKARMFARRRERA